MTTRIHVVNFGPEAVEAATSTTAPPKVLYAQQSADFYVYDGENVLVSEKKPQKPADKPE